MSLKEFDYSMELQFLNSFTYLTVSLLKREIGFNSHSVGLNAVTLIIRLKHCN